MMTAYKIGDARIVYVEEVVHESTDGFKITEVIHHVCNRHFTQYIKKRKGIPDTCKLYDSVQQREQVLFALGIVV